MERRARSPVVLALGGRAETLGWLSEFATDNRSMQRQQADAYVKLVSEVADRLATIAMSDATRGQDYGRLQVGTAMRVVVETLTRVGEFRFDLGNLDGWFSCD